MRLNWFSPLPPAKTEIALYTKRLLPFLLQKAEITLWTDQSEWDPKLEDYSEVQQYHQGQVHWAKLNLADVNIYHIGNNPRFHTTIWQASSHCHGIVVLHDVRLHHLFATIYMDLQQRDGYLARMAFHHGDQGYRDAQAFWDGRLSVDYMAEHYPLTYLALDNAQGVLVHTRQAFEQLKQEKRWSLAYAPLPYPISCPRKTDRDARSMKDVIGPPYRLIAFGFFGPNRRLDVLLEALADFPERAQFRLDIYGEISDRDQISGQICSLGLEGLATIHGFVPEGVLNKALVSSHLAMNFRYPSMGEASMSQLRIWDNSLPSLVTQTGWCGSLPHDAVAFVRPECEKADIQAHLRAFLEDSDRFARMGQKGYSILEEHHSPESYVKILMDLIGATQRSASVALAHSLADRAGSEMSAWVDESGHDQTYRRVAEEIRLLVMG